MHIEADRATYYATMTRLTGHSRRYLVVRAWVRALLPLSVLVSAFSIALSK